ncbi:MAG: hypothetical protein V1845_02625 [bacterium]
MGLFSFFGKAEGQDLGGDVSVEKEKPAENKFERFKRFLDEKGAEQNRAISELPEDLRTIVQQSRSRHIFNPEKYF